MRNGSPRIALFCAGLGRVRRGFESFTESLFLALRQYRPEMDVTLFQGGRPPADSSRRRHVCNLHRNDVPARWLRHPRSDQLEKRSFALGLYPKLIAGGYDVVHYNELVAGSVLFHLRRLFGGRFKLVYCNGAPSPPMHYHHRCDFAQVINGPQLTDAVGFDIDPGRLFLIPYGIDTDRFSPRCSKWRNAVRQELGIPDDAYVVLTACALSATHKRLNYVIDEVAASWADTWLVACGQETNETADLRRLAEQRLPGRFRFISRPYDQMHKIYGCADAFILGSLTEGLGLVFLEAMASGLPVIAHNGPVYQWVLEGYAAAHSADLAVPGAAGDVIARLRQDKGLVADVSQLRERFSWESLVPQYVEMLSRAAC